jgi:hypothetical protein
MDLDFFLAFFLKKDSLLSMKIKGKVAILLLFTLSLLIFCKSSLLDLCPSFEEQKPSCHQQASKSSTPKTDCDCPYAYTELKLEDSQLNLSLELTKFISTFFNSSLKSEEIRSIFSYKRVLKPIYSSTYQYLDTIRLTI